MTVIGYARCSTDSDKQDVGRQFNEFKKLGYEVEKIYYEYESGSRIDRKEFNKMFAEVKEGDTIISTEVSRITRSTKQLCEVIELAQQKKLKLVIGTFIVDCSNGEIDPMTEGMLKMMGVFAEMEKGMISQRVKSGLDNAVANGKVLGRPQTTSDDVPHIFLKHYPKYKAKQINVTEFSRLCNLSRNSIYKYVKLVEGGATNENK